MDGYTVFDRVRANEFAGAFTGTLSGAVTGGVSGFVGGAATGISSADSLTLTASQKNAPFAGITLTAASKTVTLGLPNGRVMFVHNAGGTNSFTLKNVSGDSGTALAAGKLALVAASETANGSKVLVLN